MPPMKTHQANNYLVTVATDKGVRIVEIRTYFGVDSAIQRAILAFEKSRIFKKVEIVSVKVINA